METLKLQILFEEDKAEGNVSAYIPVFRLGVIGDTLEEARANAIDLVQAELELAKQQGIFFIKVAVELRMYNNLFQDFFHATN